MTESKPLLWTQFSFCLCPRLLFFCGNSSLSAACDWLFNLVIKIFRTDNPIKKNLKLTLRSDANIQKAFACRYHRNGFRTVVKERIHVNFCLRCFYSLTHLDLLKNGTESAAATCSGFCAQSWAWWWKLQTVSLRTLAFSFHW